MRAAVLLLASLLLGWLFTLEYNTFYSVYAEFKDTCQNTNGTFVTYSKTPS
jgi:hypothetical protein